MDYENSVKYLDSLGLFTVKLGLKRIKAILERHGNPERNQKIIHIAGTNGKGSVCEMIRAILTEAGYNVGTYVSPHLERFTERIRVNDKEIPERDVARLTKKIKPLVKKYKATFFEAVTTMAFLFFKEKNVDFVVLETGLGGRLDATNAASGMISIITNIGMEHTQYLGNTTKRIAREKAGIIKNNSVVITGAT
ncbi:hypothetical protein JXA85_02005 [Candidatus Woesearchaeota archaeon]|nr:hypothetical protein [Candidatus Woesearchaeota archaeon]